VHLVGSYYTAITRCRYVQTPQTAVWRTVLHYVTINSADNVLTPPSCAYGAAEDRSRTSPHCRNLIKERPGFSSTSDGRVFYSARILGWMNINVFITGDKLTQMITMISIKRCWS